MTAYGAAVFAAIALWLAWQPPPVISNRSGRGRPLAEVPADGVARLLSLVQLQVAGGATVRDAWSAALAADSGFPAPAVRRCLAIHSDLPSALREDAATCPEFALAAVVVQLGEASGAPVSQPLGDVAQIARDRVEIDRTVAQEVAATKASVAVLAGLPGFGLCLAWLLGSDPAWLIHSPAGLLCLLGGLVLEVSGALWLRRMVRVAVKC